MLLARAHNRRKAHIDCRTRVQMGASLKYNVCAYGHYSVVDIESAYVYTRSLFRTLYIVAYLSAGIAMGCLLEMRHFLTRISTSIGDEKLRSDFGPKLP